MRHFSKVFLFDAKFIRIDSWGNLLVIMFWICHLYLPNSFKFNSNWTHRFKRICATNFSHSNKTVCCVNNFLLTKKIDFKNANKVSLFIWQNCFLSAYFRDLECRDYNKLIIQELWDTWIFFDLLPFSRVTLLKNVWLALGSDEIIGVILLNLNETNGG